MASEDAKGAPLSTEPYKGVRDFYPEDWARLSYCFDTIRRVLGTYGYEEYMASPLERAELYESKTSEEITGTQTYTFLDRGERRVTLRPEMTPTLARMVAGRRRELPLPIRWFSIPNVFRYERPQRGRLREHYQLNVDLVGGDIEVGDREILLIAARIMQAFGATPKDFVIRVSSRALLSAATAALGLSSEQAAEYASLLDRKNKLSADDFERERSVYRRNGTDPLELIESGTDGKVAEARAYVDRLVAALSDAGVTSVVYDPSIVRGFLYYTGMVFEVFDTSPENPRSIFGGGRFDKLVSVFGGDPMPAVGFGMGDVTLQDFLTTHGLMPDEVTGAPQLFVGVPGSDAQAAADAFAEKLRAAGARVLVGTASKGLGDQIKEANRRHVPYFIAYGTDEAASGQVSLKTLADGSQRTVSADEVPGALA